MFRAIPYLIIFLFLCNDIQAQGRRTLDLNSRQYVSLTELRRHFSGIQTSVNELELTAEISYAGRSVTIEADRPYFTSSGKQYTLGKAVLIKKNEIFVPVEMIEDIFTLLKLPIDYNLNKTQLETQQSKRPNPFQPKTVAGKTELDFIVLDAGHGGRDPGAFGVGKVREKDITLAMTKVVFRHLRAKFPGTKVYVTRTRDVFMSLEERARIANSRIARDKFGIFISLHCNATFSSRVAGLEVYHLSLNPSNREGRELSLRENRIAEGRGYIEKLESMLINAQIQAESRELAEQMESRISRSISGRMNSRGVKKADFAVLRGALMPAILIEMGYITHKNEAALLRSKSFQKTFALGIERGIRYFLKNRPKI